MNQLLKCTICGEIFSASLSNCPVCGVGPECFVPVQSSTQTAIKNTNDIFIILGGGTAALNAAKAIRTQNKTCGITLVTSEPTLPYHRPMLTKSIASSNADASLLIYPEQWYQDQNICTVTENAATKIDPKNQQVFLENGIVLSYTKLIYALGAECFIPDFAKTNFTNVCAIRKLTDLEKVKSHLQHTKNAVVIGGGVLGLEAADALNKCGVSVTVVHTSDRVMNRQLDEESALLLQECAKKQGVSILLNASTEKILGDTYATGILLRDGRTLPADLIILSCGIAPNISLAKEAGIHTSRAICVNSRMETNLLNIYACGDCAEYNGINYAVWEEASTMGKIAGFNATDTLTEYQQITPAVTFSGFGTKAFAIGSFEQDAKETREQNPATGALKKYWYQGNQLKGAILIGDISDAPSLLNQF